MCENMSVLQGRCGITSTMETFSRLDEIFIVLWRLLQDMMNITSTLETFSIYDEHY